MTFGEFQHTVKQWLPDIKRITTRYFYQGTAVFYKEDKSPVTAADRQVEEYLADEIGRLFPHHGITGEETGSRIKTQNTEYEWIIDPIDGTRSFICGVPLFSSLIGLLKHGQPLYGAIYVPVSEDVVFGDGRKALLNGKPVGMREIKSVEEAVVVSSSITDIFKYHNGEKFMRFAGECRSFRTWGDGYGYYLLACGKADVMVDPVMSRWDLLPVIPIIRGAGGMITDYYGNDPVSGNSAIASHPRIHAEILRRVSLGSI